jgi:hypothetical protein
MGIFFSPKVGTKSVKNVACSHCRVVVLQYKYRTTRETVTSSTAIVYFCKSINLYDSETLSFLTSWNLKEGLFLVTYVVYDLNFLTRHS